MYQDHFGLNLKPFGIVPDTRFLFLSDSHKEAIAHLVYALNEKNGFVQLTGEVGVGKTLACRYILANIPKDIDVALILNPRIDEISLLQTLCQELNIPFNEQHKTNELTQLINNKLLDSHASGRHTILIIDEAQNLPKLTLEQLRLLTNLETDTQKLLRIIMIGQPELAELLAAHDMRQVAQRITSRYHLTTLNPEETDQYINHRLAIAGCRHRLFSRAATRKIHKLSHGTPRLINLLCDHALIGAYSLGTQEVTPSIVNKVAREALPSTEENRATSRPLKWPLLLMLMLLILAAYQYRDTLQKTAMQYGLIPPAATLSPPPEDNSDPSYENNSVPGVSTPPPAPLEEKASSLNTTPAAEVAGSARHSTLSPEKLEAMKTQAELDFRLGIPDESLNPEAAGPASAAEATPQQ